MAGLWRLAVVDPRAHVLVLILKRWKERPGDTLVVYADAKNADLFDPGDLWELPGWKKKESGRNPRVLPPG